MSDRQPEQVGMQPANSPASLRGTGLVADDLYLLAHDDRTGKRRLGARPLGIGLAAALLTELMLEDVIGLQRGGVLVAHRRRSGDILGCKIQAQIGAERAPLTLRDWLQFFAEGAAKDVAGRLERAGYLERVRTRIPGRVRSVPVDSSLAFAPMLRVRSALNPARPFDLHGAVLTGLADACGLDFHIAQYHEPGLQNVAQIVEQLRPNLRLLVAEVQAAKDSAVLSQRT